MPTVVKFEAPSLSAEDLSAALIRAASVPIVAVDRDGMIIEWNRAAEDLYGWSAAEAIGRPIAILVPPNLHADYAADFERLRAGERVTVETQRMRKDGTLVDVALALAPMFDRRGRNIGVSAVVHDLGPTRRREAEIRDRLFLFERAEEVAHVGSWIWDATTNHVSWSEGSRRIFGCAPGSELTLEDAIRIVHPDDRLKIEARFRAAVEHDAPYVVEFRVIGPDGAERWVHARGSVVRSADGAPLRFVGINFDLTEQRRAMEALAASESRYRTILETTTQGVWTIDVAGRTTFMNAQMAKMIGITPAEAVGRLFTDFLSEDKRGEAREQLARRNEGISERVTSKIRRVDGTEIHVFCDTSPLVGTDGKIFGALAMVSDMTEQLAQARILAQREEELRQAQKLEAIGSLAGGIAHDFNNILTVILSYTSLLIDECTTGDPRRDDLEEVKKAGERARDLTAQLLAFSRRQVLQPTVLEIDTVLLDLEKMLRRLLGEDIALCLHAASQARVHADRGQLEQVVVNLAVNARDAMPSGGTLAIETGVVQLDPEDAELHHLTPGGYVRVIVRDTGCGMDDATRARIFEPFFTTKELGKGTGLGLSTVFGIVKQSGGTIEVDSRLGKGTTFEIFLPRSDRATDEHPVSRRPTAQSGTETILLVEDDDQVRALLRAVLRRLGYGVIEARNAGEALLVCEQEPQSIDLMITDVVMPRMTGPQLAERVARLRPRMRTLFMSGYTDNGAVRDAVSRGDIAFLPKPVTPDAVARRVRDALDRVRA